MVLPAPRPYAESAASLARILSAIPPPAPVHDGSPEPVATPAPPQARRLPLFVGALLIGALSVALLSPREQVSAHPVLLIALVGFAGAVDLMRIDIFDRSNVSPASVPRSAGSDRRGARHRGRSHDPPRAADQDVLRPRRAEPRRRRGGRRARPDRPE